MARRRRSCGPVLSAGERLETRRALAVDVMLSGSTLSLVYGAVGDAATLAVDDDFNYTVTGDSGTVVTGSATTGSFDSVFSVVVVNESVGGGQSFAFSGADFVQVLAGLSVGSATAGISQVTITAPEFFGTTGPVAIYADDVTIPTTVYGPGQSLVIVATGTVSIDTIDEFEGSIAISCDSLSMSGSLLNDGFSESGPASDSLAGGVGYAVSISATNTIDIAGAVSSNGGSCIIDVSGSGSVVAGNGGAISLVAGGAITVAGGVSAAGGSVTGGSATEAIAGAGGSITITSGASVSVGGMSVAGGSTQSGTGTTATGGAAGAIAVTAATGITVSGSINAAGGTGQTSDGANGTIEIGIEPATPSAAMLAVARDARPRLLGVRTAGIVGGEIRLNAGGGVIELQGDITGRQGRTGPGSITLDGDVSLRRGVRLDTTAAGVGSFVIVTGAIDGGYPLVVAAGGGNVRFAGAIGGVRPLAGIRFESAGSVVAAQRLRVDGAARGALRHGIEIAAGVNNVDLSQGGEIRNFRSGQALHAPGNTRGSVIKGFRIANAGRPFFGAGDSTGTTFAGNFVVQPVARPATATIGVVGGSYGGGIQLTGRARSGDTVTLYADGRAIGAMVAAHGRWTITTSALGPGSHAIQVRALTPAGIAGGFSRTATIRTSSPGTPS